MIIIPVVRSTVLNTQHKANQYGSKQSQYLPFTKAVQNIQLGREQINQTYHTTSVTSEVHPPLSELEAKWPTMDIFRA